MAGVKRTINGFRVEVWSTSYRIVGGAGTTFLGRHITEDDIAEDLERRFGPKPKGTPTMNLNTLAALVRSDVTTASVYYGNNENRVYIFKILRSLAETLSPGDPVIVHCANGYKVVTLLEVHDDPRLDPEDGNDYAWIFQAVNTAGLETLMSQEEHLVEKLRAQRQQSYRRQALAAFGIQNPDQFVQELIGAPEKE